MPPELTAGLPCLPKSGWSARSSISVRLNCLGEAAARQQQLGLEQQRVGYEGERVGIERGRAAQEAQYQTGMLGETQKRTSIEQQRADAEHQYQTGMLDKSGKQLEEEIRFHNQQGTLEQNRINLEKGAQGLMKQRMQMEEDHFDQQIRMQGLTFNRQIAEDERKQLHTALDEWAKSNSWSTWLQGKDFFIQQHQAVDAFIDDKLRQVAGPTPFPSATPKVPITVTGVPPGSQSSKPAYFVSGKWYDIIVRALLFLAGCRPTLHQPDTTTPAQARAAARVLRRIEGADRGTSAATF